MGYFLRNVKLNTTNPTLYGANIGYDKKFDNAILGLSVGYINLKSENKDFKNNINNLQTSFYTKSYIGQKELDFKINIGLGKNNISRKTNNNEGKFNSLNLSINLDYGYVYKLNNGLFIKPFTGILYSIVSSKPFNETCSLALAFNKTYSKSVNVKICDYFYLFMQIKLT